VGMHRGGRVDPMMVAIREIVYGKKREFLYATKREIVSLKNKTERGTLGFARAT
jgi:hypothetical protein